MLKNTTLGFSSHLDERHVRRRRITLIFVSLLISYGYFFQGPGWNQNSRFDLARAIVDHRTFQIDAYHLNTGDKSYYNGHYYSDKAPGLSFMAAGVYALTQGAVPEAGRGRAIPLHLATWLCVGLPVALAACGVFRLAEAVGASADGATFAMLAFGFATPAFVFSSMLMGHATAAACLVYALWAVMRLGKGISVRRDFWLALAMGLAAGWATVVEFPAGLAAAILAIAAVLRVWRGGRRRVLAVALGVGLGAVVCMAIIGWYQYEVFGSPLHMAYSNVVNYQQQMATGFMGLTYPKLDVIRQLLIRKYRGLFIYAPVLIFGVIGLVAMVRARRTRFVGVVSSAIALSYLLINASYEVWDGGHAYGPRHLVPAVPFLCLGLAVMWDRGRGWWRWPMMVCAWLGLMVNLVGLATDAMPTFMVRFPIRDAALNFFYGLIPINSSTMWNVGHWFGLTGTYTLVPLVAAWIALGVTAKVLAKGDRRSSGRMEPARVIYYGAGGERRVANAGWRAQRRT